MVQWKGNISEDGCGGRASRLDRVEGLQVPNFFVVTKEELGEFLEDTKNEEEALKKEFPDDLTSNIKDAYSDINVSSEVRNASGRARDLVEGQRNGGKVTVRVSGDRKGVYTHRINVGASGLIDAIHEVAASYYRAENDDAPAVIVQRMIEPDASGAAITSYMGNYGLLEVVKGLGTSLEDGTTTPEFYILDNGKIAQTRVPDEQIETTVNPMNGDKRQKMVKRNQPIFQRSEVEKLFENLRKENVNAKFVYKRGSFYIVDVFEPSKQAFDSAEVSLNAIRVSTGDIDGILGREISYTDETVPPEQYSEGLISRKGGYTSRDAQLARNEGKPALFSLNTELEQGVRIRSDSQSTEVKQKSETERRQEREKQHQSYASDRNETVEDNEEAVAGTDIIPLNSGNGLYLSPPFTGRYAVTDTPARNPDTVTVSPDNYLTDFGDFFRFDGDRAIVDARNIRVEGLENAMSYLEAELKIVILDRPTPELVRKAVEEDYTIAVSPGSMDSVQTVVSRQERKFILEKLRELD